MWFDNPQSLALKVAIAAELGLAGVGVWNLETLDYTSSDPHVMAETEAMWDAMKRPDAPTTQHSVESLDGQIPGHR